MPIRPTVATDDFLARDHVFMSNSLLWRIRFRGGEFVNTPWFTVDVSEGCGPKNRSARKKTTPGCCISFSPKWVPIGRSSLFESNRAFFVELGVQQSRSGIPASEPVFVADGAGLRGIKRTA